MNTNNIIVYSINNEGDVSTGLIDCECCGKKISEDSTSCIYCGHPINEHIYTLLFAYQYKGKVLNTSLYREDVKKLDVLQKVKKVILYDKTYRILDIICNAYNEIIYVIIDDI